MLKNTDAIRNEAQITLNMSNLSEHELDFFLRCNTAIEHIRAKRRQDKLRIVKYKTSNDLSQDDAEYFAAAAAAANEEDSRLEHKALSLDEQHTTHTFQPGNGSMLSSTLCSISDNVRFVADLFEQRAAPEPRLMSPEPSTKAQELKQRFEARKMTLAHEQQREYTKAQRFTATGATNKVESLAAYYEQRCEKSKSGATVSRTCSLIVAPKKVFIARKQPNRALSVTYDVASAPKLDASCAEADSKLLPKVQNIIEHFNQLSTTMETHDLTNNNNNNSSSSSTVQRSSSAQLSRRSMPMVLREDMLKPQRFSFKTLNTTKADASVEFDNPFMQSIHERVSAKEALEIYNQTNERAL